MYIPAINLLLLSFSSLTGLFSSLPEVADSETFHPNFKQHFATLTPYHDRSHVPGVWAELPPDCTVDQVMMVRIQAVLWFP